MFDEWTGDWWQVIDQDRRWGGWQIILQFDGLANNASGWCWMTQKFKLVKVKGNKHLMLNSNLQGNAAIFIILPIAGDDIFFHE